MRLPWSHRSVAGRELAAAMSSGQVNAGRIGAVARRGDRRDAAPAGGVAGRYAIWLLDLRTFLGLTIVVYKYLTKMVISVLIWCRL